MCTSCTAPITIASPPRTTNSKKQRNVERYVSMMNSTMASMTVSLRSELVRFRYSVAEPDYSQKDQGFPRTVHCSIDGVDYLPVGSCSHIPG